MLNQGNLIPRSPTMGKRRGVYQRRQPKPLNEEKSQSLAAGVSAAFTKPKSKKTGGKVPYGQG